MKIIHLTVVRDLPNGVMKQLYYEWKSARVEGGFDWETVAWHDSISVAPFLTQVPWCFRFIFLRQLFSWFLILKLSRQCDYLLVRHMPFDPFSFIFSPFVKNRITVHHTKEVEEMVQVRRGWKGKMASRLESVAGRFSLRRTAAIAGVTQEIVDYELVRAGTLLPGVVYPNGIDTEAVPLLDDGRSDATFNLVFICSKFSSWHGLERLFDSVIRFKEPGASLEIKVHLVGQLSDEQRKTIIESDILSEVFIAHGLLEEDKYREVMAGCDVGVGSLAMELTGLREASTLKVREMLAMGLPVVSGHVDSSLPESFPYYQIHADGEIDLARVLSSFGSKKYRRDEVREAAEPLIEKQHSMRSVASFLASGL